MTAYYNENDPKAAQWLRNLIAAGLIAPGKVDSRSILEVRPHDLEGFTQCHFFAGIGVWSFALRSAGWRDDRPVWTGSCPCQPFSDAGAKAGFDDERHLWPAWFELIRERRPVVIFGEQVASKDAFAWLDHVHADLESAAYTVGAVDTCAAGFGAPHIRQRIHFVADSGEIGLDARGRLGGEPGGQPDADRGRAPFELGHSSGGGRRELGDEALARSSGHADGAEQPRGMVDAERARLEGLAGNGDDGNEPGRERAVAPGPAAAAGSAGGMADSLRDAAGEHARELPGDEGEYDERAEERDHGSRDRSTTRAVADDDEDGRLLERSPRLHDNGQSGDDAPRCGPTNGFWAGAEWIPCRDGKSRPAEPGTFPAGSWGCRPRGAPARLRQRDRRPGSDRIHQSIYGDLDMTSLRIFPLVAALTQTSARPRTGRPLLLGLWDYGRNLPDAALRHQPVSLPGLALFFAAALLSGCAVIAIPHDDNIIDPKGVDPARYKADFLECQDLARHTLTGYSGETNVIRRCLAGRGYSVVN